jgi:lipopolysaccharide export system protein LptC
MTVVKDDNRAAERPRRRNALSGLATRQRLTGEQAAARSTVVRRLRLALPVLAVVLVVVFLLSARPDVADEAFLKDFASLDATPEELGATNPGYAGLDAQGNPYRITASEVLQRPDTKEVFELVSPRAVTSKGDDDTVVTADRGVFERSTSFLQLSEGVELRQRVGGGAYVLRTPAAKVALREETVESDEGVVGEGESAILRADRMRAYNSEGRVVFEGNVSMRIYPEKTVRTGADGERRVQ